MANKGSMTTELFVDFINHLGQYKSPGKALLIFDGAACHLDARIVDAADKSEISLYCLPSNTTHELQPLDKSVNKSYEHHWDQEVLLYAYQHPDRKLTKQRFGKIFTKVWSKCMTQENITNGFRATGIYPYDPNAIPEEAYAPSALTQNPGKDLHDSMQAPETESEDMHITPLPSPTMRRNSSDSDATFYEVTEHLEGVIEETHQDVSPSIFLTAVQRNNSAHGISEKTNTDIPTSLKQLVNYSSSTESGLPDDDHQNLLLCVPNDRHFEFQSPVPTTSGLNIRSGISRINSSTSSSLSHDEMSRLNILPNPYKKFHIYSSESESDQENINPQVITSLTNNEKDETDDSDDNIPISKLKGNGKRSTGLFKEHIPTPNFATTKRKPRRKAINYIGQKITKDLFETTKNKTKDTKTKKGKTPRTKLMPQGKLPNKKQELRSNKKTKNKNNKEKRTDAVNKETWYCQACEEERIADMRQCKDCRMWFHEECVGLTKKDTEMFVCPSCDKK